MFLLYLFSLIYGGAVSIRNLLYDRGILKTKKLPVPVISVGNISAGGSGKTSLVRFLAQELGRTLRVAILLRGYRRKSKGTLVVSEWGELKTDAWSAGDEAYLLARLLPEVSVVVSEDRYRGGLLAVEELGAELVILDDGFQHRKLYRDLDVVLIKRRDLSDRLLPAGLLREPLKNLKRADAIVLSYQDVEPFEFSIEGKPVFKLFREFRYLLNSSFERVPLEELRGEEVVAFAGLGDNEQFFKTLERLNFKVKDKLSFPDHHDYRDFRLEKDKLYITTPKDMVKLPPSENLYALDFEVRVDGLLTFLMEKLGMADRFKKR
ncbi:lipid-A-disaccharide kinase [Hydrogenivirga caldilitoris]|uniref:Tetraacyldisaccharide 4'-kinase n=1 Tax=Hydrogenivirga caldilitoris TaxID=246264 RepID=A0A497XPC5_9AQUI|nr:tetraacyldisaccharide 4'-kinase [Hydrogenivirga caldilitoris]RLJ70728.1 lipid-A-disaccharide kinase [Hydrogenivirga caldilitoris]